MNIYRVKGEYESETVFKGTRLNFDTMVVAETIQTALEIIEANYKNATIFSIRLRYTGVWVQAA